MEQTSPTQEKKYYISSNPISINALEPKKTFNSLSPKSTHRPYEANARRYSTSRCW